jgi:hypothetical protein
MAANALTGCKCHHSRLDAFRGHQDARGGSSCRIGGNIFDVEPYGRDTGRSAARYRPRPMSIRARVGFTQRVSIGLVTGGMPASRDPSLVIAMGQKSILEIQSPLASVTSFSWCPAQVRR